MQKHGMHIVIRWHYYQWRSIWNSKRRIKQPNLTAINQLTHPINQSALPITRHSRELETHTHTHTYTREKLLRTTAIRQDTIVDIGHEAEKCVRDVNNRSQMHTPICARPSTDVKLCTEDAGARHQSWRTHTSVTRRLYENGIICLDWFVTTIPRSNFRCRSTIRIPARATLVGQATADETWACAYRKLDPSEGSTNAVEVRWRTNVAIIDCR